MTKSLPGVSLIGLSLILTAVAWISNPATQIYAGAGIALTSLSLTFMLATRHSILETLFHGIEKMYFYHKILAVFSIIFLLLHQVTMGDSQSFGALLGSIAINMFLAIIAVAYLGKKLKYEIWRLVHRLVFLAYLIGLLHAYMLSPVSLFDANLLGIIVNLFSFLGILSGLYIIFFYQEIGFSYLGKIAAIKHINYDTTEIKIKLNKEFNYEYGQFAFIKIFQKGFEKAPHPFSISGGRGKIIYFTIKSAGDHTSQIYKELKVGSKVKLDRAYGHMILNQGHQKQVWIAGGIGITPFISYIRNNSSLDKEIDFFYAYTGEENAVYLDMLRDYAKNNPKMTLHLVNSKVDGFLNFDNYSLSDNTTVFMCGPLPMMTAFSRTFKEKNPKAELVYEGFSFK